MNAGTGDPTTALRSDGQATSSPENTLGLPASQSGAGVIPANFGYDSGGTGQMNSLV